jgi:hypothetical protein
MLINIFATRPRSGTSADSGGVGAGNKEIPASAALAGGQVQIFHKFFIFFI